MLNLLYYVTPVSCLSLGMHHTALQNAARFFDAYPLPGATVVDIGAQDITGSVRSVCPHKYVGVDFVPGPGVDVVLDDPYKLPFADSSQDIIVTSSCFEHSEFFWLLFLEIMRVLKPHGLLYLQAPSNGDIHRFPVDCWRFYPDAGPALARWARRNGYNTELLEHYTSDRDRAVWNDYVAVFVKDEVHTARYPDRITQRFSDYRNGLNGEKSSPWPQDQATLAWRLRRIVYFFRNEKRPLRRLRDIFLELRAGKRGLWPNTVGSDWSK